MVTAPIYPRVEEQRYLALLHAANAIATCNDCRSASDTLSEKLREVTPFDSLHLVAFDMRLQRVPPGAVLEANGREVNLSVNEDSILEDSPIQWVHSSGELLVVADWSQETRFANYGSHLNQLGTLSTCTLAV